MTKKVFMLRNKRTGDLLKRSWTSLGHATNYILRHRGMIDDYEFVEYDLVEVKTYAFDELYMAAIIRKRNK